MENKKEKIDQKQEPKVFEWVANTPTKNFNQIRTGKVDLVYTPNGWVIKE
jgi:hypothetical protein